MAITRKEKRIRVSLRTRTVAVVSIALPLVLLGWICLVKIMQEGIKKQVQEDFTFTLMLEKDATDASINLLTSKLKKQPAIKDVRYISPSEAAEEVGKELNENPVEVLGYNPFYPSIELNLHARYANRDSLPKVDSLIRTLGGVSNFEFRGDVLDEVDAVIEKLSLVLYIGIVLMLVIAIIQMSNTTHLLIYARRFLIRSMTLLGAPYRQICKPILQTTVLNGLWGGILADVLVAGSLWLAASYMSDAVLRYAPTPYLIGIAILLPLLGILLSLITGLLATRRYIRMDGSRIILG